MNILKKSRLFTIIMVAFPYSTFAVQMPHVIIGTNGGSVQTTDVDSDGQVSQTLESVLTNSSGNVVGSRSTSIDSKPVVGTTAINCNSSTPTVFAEPANGCLINHIGVPAYDPSGGPISCKLEYIGTSYGQVWETLFPSPTCSGYSFGPLNVPAGSDIHFRWTFTNVDGVSSIVDLDTTATP